MGDQASFIREEKGKTRTEPETFLLKEAKPMRIKVSPFINGKITC